MVVYNISAEKHLAVSNSSNFTVTLRHTIMLVCFHSIARKNPALLKNKLWGVKTNVKSFVLHNQLI